MHDYRGLLENSYVYVYCFRKSLLGPLETIQYHLSIECCQTLETSLVKPYPTVILTILLWSLPCALKEHPSQTTLMYMHMYSDIISESLESLEMNANTIFVVK